MTRVAKLTADQIETIIALREKNYEAPQIAEMVGATPTQVYYHCREFNMAKGGGNWSKNKPFAAHIRNGKIVRPYTPDEDSKIENLRLDGMAMAKIAAKIGRGYTSVRHRLITLANQSEGLC